MATKEIDLIQKVNKFIMLKIESWNWKSKMMGKGWSTLGKADLLGPLDKIDNETCSQIWDKLLWV